MVLCDASIRRRLALPEGDPRRLVIRPFVDYDDFQPEGSISYGLSSGGYDLRAGNNFLLFTNTSGCIVSPKKFRPENFVRQYAIDHTAVVIPPNSFALAETVEYLEIPHDVITLTTGKSTCARAGYVVPLTPFEPGWRGRVTVEIGNLSPLPMEVYAGEGLFQVLFLQLDRAPERTYDMKPRKHYQDQKGLTPPTV